MKTHFLSILLVLVGFNIVIAQNTSIVAGEYDSTMTYFNIDPDTILVCEEHPGETKHYDIDLNYDGILDYRFKVYEANGLGGGYGSTTIIPYNQNEVIYYRVDTSLASDSSFIFRKVVKPFEYGEKIDDSCEFRTGNTYFRAVAWTCTPYFTDFSFSDWIGLQNNYVGLRMNFNDTLVYGWIKIELPDGNKLIVEEYALSKKYNISFLPSYLTSYNVEVYPNPVNDYLYFRILENMKVSKVEIFDIDGKSQKSIKIYDTGQFKIGTGNLKSGIYILKISTGEKIYTRKIVKK